jgi:hypothetical protein
MQSDPLQPQPIVRLDYNKHVNWLPGEPGTPGLAIRNLHLGDVNQAHRAFRERGYHVRLNRVMFAAQAMGWQLRGVVRNTQYLTCCSLSSHGPKYNDVRALGVSDEYLRRDSYRGIVLPRFLSSLREELVELPTRIRVTRSLDEPLSPILKELGFHLVDVEDDYKRWYAPRLYSSDAPRAGHQADRSGSEPPVGAPVPPANE